MGARARTRANTQRTQHTHRTHRNSTAHVHAYRKESGACVGVAPEKARRCAGQERSSHDTEAHALAHWICVQQPRGGGTYRLRWTLARLQSVLREDSSTEQQLAWPCCAASKSAVCPLCVRLFGFNLPASARTTGSSPCLAPRNRAWNARAGHALTETTRLISLRASQLCDARMRSCNSGSTADMALWHAELHPWEGARRIALASLRLYSDVSPWTRFPGLHLAACLGGLGGWIHWYLHDCNQARCQGSN